MANAPAQAQQVQIGSLFGMPGVTRPTEQPDNNDQIVTVLSQASQIDAQFPANFKQTDIVEWWEMEVSIAQTLTTGSSTLTQSPYFPYSYLGPVALNMQNQFNTVDVTNGIDLAIFQMIRPHYDNMLNVLDQNSISNAYSAQANAQTGTGYTYAAATTSLRFAVDLAPGIFFDQYWECDSNGRPRHKDPIRAFVSPQLMAGTNRVIQPKVRFNPISSAILDGGPGNIGAGSGTGAGSATLGFQRFGYYQPQGPADTPLLFNWQYAREAKRYSAVAGVASVDIPLPLSGQILSVWARLFDPAANGGLGAPITVGGTAPVLKNAYLQYGSGLYRYQDSAQRVQRRLLRQHQMLLPEGVIAWDLSLDKYGRVTNQYALNTLDTSGIQIHFDFNSTLSSTAYVVIGVESLRYVAQM